LRDSISLVFWMSFVDVQDVKLSTWYALHLAPADCYQCCKEKNALGRFIAFKQFMIRWCNYHLPVNDWHFYIELSDLGRLHCHGRIKFETITQVLEMYYLIFKLRYVSKRMQFSFKKIVDVLDGKQKEMYPTYLDYIKKQRPFWTACNLNSRIDQTSELKLVDKKYPKDITSFF